MIRSVFVLICLIVLLIPIWRNIKSIKDLLQSQKNVLKKVVPFFKAISKIILAILTLGVINYLVPAKPTISPDCSEIRSNEIITIDYDTILKKIFTIYYTTNGDNPSTLGKKYSTKFPINESDIKNDKITIKAKVKIFGIDWGESESQEYTISPSSSNTEIITSEPPTTQVSTLNVTSSELTTTQISTNKIDNEKENQFLYYGIEDPDENNGEIIIEEGKKFLLKSDRANFLTYNEEKLVCPNKEHPTLADAWSVYYILSPGSKNTGFICEALGKKLTCEIEKSFNYNGQKFEKCLRFSEGKGESWECFKIFRNGSFVIIRSEVEEKYWVSNPDHPYYPVKADQKNPEAWEQYSLYIYNEDEKIWINPLTGIKYEAF